MRQTQRTHLKGIQFPDPVISPIVDLVIRVDYAELHYSLKDVRGQPGEPVARLTLLVWLKGDYQSSFAYICFVREQSGTEEISSLL